MTKKSFKSSYFWKTLGLSLIGAALTWLMTGCAHSKTVTAQVFDPQGRPLAGAMVYVEVWKQSGVHDFAFGLSDAAGLISSPNLPIPSTLKLQWPSGGHLAVAAFSPGLMPLVIIDYSKNLGPENMQLHFNRRSGPDSLREPRIFNFEFPFSEKSPLRARILAPEAAELRRAFRQAHAIASASKVGLLPREDSLVQLVRQITAGD